MGSTSPPRGLSASLASRGGLPSLARGPFRAPPHQSIASPFRRPLATPSGSREDPEQSPRLSIPKGITAATSTSPRGAAGSQVLGLRRGRLGVAVFCRDPAALPLSALEKTPKAPPSSWCSLEAKEVRRPALGFHSHEHPFTLQTHEPLAWRVPAAKPNPSHPDVTESPGSPW